MYIVVVYDAPVDVLNDVLSLSAPAFCCHVVEGVCSINIVLL